MEILWLWQLILRQEMVNLCMYFGRKIGKTFKCFFFSVNTSVCVNEQWILTLGTIIRCTDFGPRPWTTNVASRRKLFSGIDWTEIFVLLKWMIKHVFILIVWNRVNVHHSLILHFQNVTEADMGKTAQTPVDSA